MRFLIAYCTAALPMLTLDALWLGLIARGFYAEHLGFLLRPTVHWAPAALFYMLYPAAIALLAVLPASSEAWTGALWRGALLGLAAYGAYDLTNHATIARWPLAVTIVDLLWGVCVTAASSVVAWSLLSLRR